MAKVYVTQETAHDFREAEAYGDVVFLSVDRRDDFFNVANSEHNRRLVAHLRQELRDFDVETDFVVPTGSPYVNAAVFALLGKKFNKLCILRWDNRDHTYIPLTIPL